MLRLMAVLCVVLATTVPVLADTLVPHVAGQTAGWRGSYNNSASYFAIGSWPNAGAGGGSDAGIAGFSRSSLQSAINSEIAAGGGWDAKIIITQVEWGGNPAIPADLGPVAGVIDVDPGTFRWGHISDNAPSAFNAGAGSWAFGGTNYSNFAAAYSASAAAGKSFLFTPTASQWTTILIPTLANPNVVNIVIDVPEDLVVRYLDNPDAEGFFVSATRTGSPAINIYQGDQWGGTADLRMLIAAPPAGAPWLNASVLSVSRIVALTSPTTSVPVTITDAFAGSINWTAAESPDVPWLSIGSPSGTHGTQLSLDYNVAGLAPGTYTTDVVVTAPGAGNVVTIPVTVNVVASAQPIIQLAPTSLSFSARPSDASPPASQAVTVNNVGLGSLSWTAAEAPDAAWLSLALTSGSNGGQFIVSVNHTGLPADTYTATVRVSDPNASNSPQDLTVTLTIRDQDADIIKANSYDDAWETGPDGWVPAMKVVHRGWTGSSGFCLLLGDSITYANPFGQWPRYGAGKTAEDTAICNWMNAGVWGSDSNDSTNGWYLAGYDVPGRNGSFTARSGITAAQYLAGSTPLPSLDAMVTAGFTNPDGKQYRDAVLAVILLGTNDLGGRTAAQLSADLGTMADKLMAAKIIPVLTTIPPRVGQDVKVGQFNDAIRALAVSKKLPLIDYYAEILRRRPGDTWKNTLISGDGVHPSASYDGSTASSDPYASSGLALSNSGYLLRSWLTVQKIKEIKAKVLDGLLGDVDGDGACNVFDVFLIAEAWNTQVGDPLYNPICDLDGDGFVNVFDIFILAEDWNKP